MKKTLLVASLLSIASTVSVAEVNDQPNLTVLAESSTGWVRNFNPWIGGRSDWAYESLVVFDILNNDKVHYWLATGFELSENLKELTVKLREGVKWSDGEGFSADDVVFTFDYAKAHPEIDKAGLSGSVASIEKIDDYTVKITLKKANAFAATEVLGENVRIVPKHVWSKIDNPSGQVNENPVGTGPFTEIKRFTPQVYVQCRNPNYWNEALKVNCLEFPQYFSNDAALEMLANGKVDWAGIFVPDIERTYTSKNPHNKYWFPSNSAVKISFNYDTKNENAGKAFKNIEFRKAVNLVMDRQAMINIGVYGYVKGGNPASALPKGLWNWRDAAADKTWSEYYQYDLKKAKKVLQGAGFKDVDGDGFVENPDGSEFEFSLQVPSGWTDYVNNAAIAVEGLRAVGINSRVITPEVNVYAENWKSDDFEANFGSGGLKPSVWRFYDYTMHSRYANTGMWWSTSLHNYKNQELDGLIDELALTLDVAKQREITAQIEATYADNVVQVPLYNNGVWYLYNDSRFEGWASEDNQIIFPAPYEGMSRIVHLMHLKPKA